MSRPPATHCKRGHPMVGDNVYSPPSNPDRRNCRTCIVARNEARDRRACLDHHVTIASLRAELASARQSIRAQRRVIADLERERSRLASIVNAPRVVTHRRRADGGIGGKRERREMRSIAA